MNTKIDFPIVHKILNILMWLLIVVIPVDYIGSELLELWSYRLGLYYAGGVILVTQIFYNAYFIRSSDPMARYIVYGTFFLAIGAISIPLLHVDIHTWIVRVCFILEMIFFTAALSQNIKKVRRAKTQAEDALKEAKIRHEYETEIKLVNERKTTEENIRSELARDIHDEIGAELTKISLSSHLLSKSDKIDDATIKLKIAMLGNDAITANQQLQQMLFSINPGYDHFSDIQSYSKELATSLFENSDIKLSFIISPSDDNPIIDRLVKSQLVMIYKEILHNIMKHAQARHILISLDLDSKSNYCLRIKDDGIGFDVLDTKKFSNGLVNMKTRCNRINAKLTIVSNKLSGTEITVTGSIFGI